MISPVLPRSTLREIVLHHHAVALPAHRPRHALAFRLERRPTEQQLPSEPDPALAGIALAAVGKLAVEARIELGVRGDGELGAGVDARGIARRARTINRERGAGQRDEGGIDRAIGIELVHPRSRRLDLFSLSLRNQQRYPRLRRSTTRRRAKGGSAGPPHQLSRKLLRILDRLGCLSFLSALASIWRMRSRVTENCWPTSSRVWSVFMPMPKRMRIIRSSRGVS
jgi:hypothetical protein